MDIEYDEAKKQSNFAKHGVDFVEISPILLDPDRLDNSDKRKDYGEERRICLGTMPGDTHVFVIVYTMRGTNIRLISARKANEREHRHYHNTSRHSPE